MFSQKRYRGAKELGSVLVPATVLLSIIGISFIVYAQSSAFQTASDDRQAESTIFGFRRLAASAATTTIRLRTGKVVKGEQVLGADIDLLRQQIRAKMMALFPASNDWCLPAWFYRAGDPAPTSDPECDDAATFTALDDWQDSFCGPTQPADEAACETAIEVDLVTKSKANCESLYLCLYHNPAGVSEYDKYMYVPILVNGHNPKPSFEISALNYN